MSYGIGEGNALKIFEENNYYPFGLSHKNYNMGQRTYNKTGGETVVVCSSCPTGYKYKFQGQERQDELGLNWDSFKWRNYDMAIGRFMSIDPLSEKYNYQSHYNFSENRVIDCRELEGLEAVKSTDGNVVNVTVRVKPINNSSQAPITNDQMQTAMSNFVSQSNKNFSGKAGNQRVNFTFINDPEATLTMEFTDRADYPEGYKDADAMMEMSSAYGAVLQTDFGNTQTGNMQISTFNSFPQPGDSPVSLDMKRPGATGSHEMGHIFGLQHLDTSDKYSNKKNEANRRNLMYERVADTKGREITEEQRIEILKTIPEIK